MGKEDGFRKKIKCGDSFVIITDVKSGAKEGSYRVQATVDGKWKTIGIYKKLTKAESIARDHAFDAEKNDSRLNDLTTEQIDLVVKFLDSGMTAADIEEYVKRTKSTDGAELETVLDEWFTAKTEDNEYSADYIGDLKFVKNGLIKHLGADKQFNTIITQDIESWIKGLTVNKSKRKISAKRHNNLRGILYTIWNWASSKKINYASENFAEEVDKRRTLDRAGGHEVLSPAEFSLMLENVDEAFLPWLSISGFSGLRQSEICGTRGRTEDRLTWEDIDWADKRIIVRPETSKTRLRRIVPMCDTLVEWLKPWRNATGYVHNARNPSSDSKKFPSQTKRLGALIGGWRSNCLRASRASYRLAQTNDLGLTAMEDGHTVDMLKKNYLNPRFKEDAKLWFDLTPATVKKLNSERVVKFKQA